MQGWKSIRERLTNAGVSINVQLVARPARTPERSLAVDANVLTVPVQHQALIHIWGIRHSQVTSQFLGKMWLILVRIKTLYALCFGTCFNRPGGPAERGSATREQAERLLMDRFGG